MRRSVATILGTLAGTGLLVAAKVGIHPPGSPDTASAAEVSTATPQADPSTGRPAPTTGTKGKTSTKSKAPVKTTTGWKDGKYTGGKSTEAYGAITVSITISGGKVTEATGKCACGSATSTDISDGAFPKLQQETLTAQSAKIATVSGATETSGAYKVSLQAALDAAKA
jgi:uncharacterized protein with FMN-binding domain